MWTAPTHRIPRPKPRANHHLGSHLIYRCTHGAQLKAAQAAVQAETWELPPHNPQWTPEVFAAIKAKRLSRRTTPTRKPQSRQCKIAPTDRTPRKRTRNHPLISHPLMHTHGAQLKDAQAAVQAETWELPPHSPQWTPEVFAAFNAKKLPPVPPPGAAAGAAKKK